MKRISLNILCCMILASCFSSVVFAASRTVCSKGEAMAAEQQAFNLSTWELMFQAFTKFSPCDDGAIAEGFDESVDILLAKVNPQYDELSSYIKRNPNFETFVLKHVAGTGTGNAIATVGKNALDCYVKFQKPICKKIALSVAAGFDGAIQDISIMEKDGTASKGQLEWKAHIQKLVNDIRRSIQK